MEHPSKIHTKLAARKGKRVRKEDNGNADGNYLSLARPKPRIMTIGPGQAIPPYRFTKEVHHFRMQVAASAFKTKTNLTSSSIQGAGAAYGFALAWSAGDLPFNFGSLFDQFRLTKIIVRITSRKNTCTTGTNSVLYVVEDYDNSTLLTGAAAAEEYENCQLIRGSDVGEGESIVVELVPCIPVASVLGSCVFSSPWQDMAVQTNTHYGMKGWYVTGAATDPSWDVDAQYWIECRNQQ